MSHPVENIQNKALKQFISAPPAIIGEREAECAVKDVEEVVVARGHDQRHQRPLRREGQLPEASLLVT